MAAKVMEYGVNRPISIKLLDKVWSVLRDMTQIMGMTPEEYCAGAVECEITLDLDAPEEFGRLLCEGWRETLEGSKSGKTL